MQHLNEWVQVASFTTVVHARPSSSSPVISAYPIGQELRVMARESGFARVQDLGSGHLGWITKAALVPRMRGYRLREQMPAEPQIVAAAEPLPPPLAESAAPHVKAAATVVPRKVAPPSPRIASAYCRVGGYSSDGNACRGRIWPRPLQAA